MCVSMCVLVFPYRSCCCQSTTERRSGLVNGVRPWCWIPASDHWTEFASETPAEHRQRGTESWSAAAVATLRFSCQLEALCSASLLILLPLLPPWSRLTIRWGSSKFLLPPQESCLAMPAPWPLACLCLSLWPAMKYQKHRNKKLIWGLILSYSSILHLLWLDWLDFSPWGDECTHPLVQLCRDGDLLAWGKNAESRYYRTID